MLDRIVDNSDTLTWLRRFEEIKEFLRDALEVVSNRMKVNVSKMTCRECASGKIDHWSSLTCWAIKLAGRLLEIGRKGSEELTLSDKGGSKYFFGNRLATDILSNKGGSVCPFENCTGDRTVPDAEEINNCSPGIGVTATVPLFVDIKGTTSGTWGFPQVMGRTTLVCLAKRCLSVAIQVPSCPIASIHLGVDSPREGE
jgi:hypothetical protein